MPLDKSGSKTAVGKNISELKATGRPQKQAVAIAMDTQRKVKGFNKGGSIHGEAAPSAEQAFENNKAEALVYPGPAQGLKKGGSVVSWKRWGKK